MVACYSDPINGTISGNSVSQMVSELHVSEKDSLLADAKRSRVFSAYPDVSGHQRAEHVDFLG